MQYIHTTVLLEKAVKGLNIKPEGVYLDGTFGCGGHSKLILSMLNSKGRLIAIDCDPNAIKIAKNINDPRFIIIHDKFSKMLHHIQQLNLIGKINGIILDLGVSSPQLDNPQRGFSFMKSGILDMRMDTSKGQSAAYWLSNANINEITWVLKTFGEERFAKRIAKAIEQYKKKKNITYTHELVKLITNVVPYYEKKIHPARRSFQGIRIFINNELEEIKMMLSVIFQVLSVNGRISIISFHSLEDRIIKQFIYQNSRIQIQNDLPLTEDQIFQLYKKQIKFKIIEKIKPSFQEIKNNYRARSAILRIAEKI